MPTKTISSDYNILTWDENILVDASTNAVTLYLPSHHCIGRRYIVKHKAGDIETYPVTVTSIGSDTIDNSPSYTLTVDLQAIMIHSDGHNWYVV